MTLTKLTQTEAARAAGVSRTSIWRLIKQGRLSAERREDGNLRVDLSELRRVFPEASPERVHERAPAAASSAHERVRERADAHSEHAELRALQALVGELKADKLHRDGEVAYLREELRHAREERTRLSEERDRLLRMLEEQSAHVRLLTDQRTRKSWWRRWW
jgi:chromosome segregation ATPase